MIKILEKNVADKIAAGEVIDRPVSIIKELLENSIDAGASTITVEIKNGGKSYIRVTDNGCGIPSDEAELAFMRHATSKIQSENDLDAIKTLGFRGEALASICAVARVELITKTLESKVGRKVVIEGSQTLENTGIGCPEGTTVTVRDLFFNVPARHKFLASDSAEARRITDMVSRIALSYGDIKITLINSSKIIFSTKGRGRILDNIISIYGSDTGRDLLPVQSSAGGFFLKGFVSPPAISLASRNRQIFCVNGRVISSKVMERALDEAYKEKLFQGRFPAVFLFLSIPPEKLDVNIHPTKKEIRFDDSFEVEDFVKKAVIDTLAQKDSLPQIRSSEITKRQYDIAPPEPPEVREKVRFVPDEEQVDINNILTSLRREQNTEEIAVSDNTEQLTTNENTDLEISSVSRISIDKPLTQPFDITGLQIIGTVFNTYILASDSDTFYLIDQHAAHERIFYEKLLQQYNTAEKNSQQLLIPLTFNVSAGVTASENEWIEQLGNMGYDIEFFGNNTYRVREIPAFMSISEAEAFLKDYFSEAENKPDFTNQTAVNRIITRACKSAVKGGDNLDTREIDALMKDLSVCINPFSCPHGRPTFVRMSKYEIEKMFKRV